jgi:hypothetical protein
MLYTVLLREVADELTEPALVACREHGVAMSFPETLGMVRRIVGAPD